MSSLYATTVHARLSAAAIMAGVQCAVIDTIDPDDMVVSKMMLLCRDAGVSYASVFATRDSTDSTTSARSRSSATHSLIEFPKVIGR